MAVSANARLFGRSGLRPDHARPQPRPILGRWLWRLSTLRLRVLALVLPLLGGCTHQVATTGERADSLAALADRKVGTDRLETYVQERTAILIGGLATETTANFARGAAATGQPVMHGRYATGSATAIDRRGYFLTAGHCIAWQPLHLLLAERDQVRLAPVRVVWRDDRHEPDLALLHVAGEMSAWFEWADEGHVGDTVIAAGPEFDHPVAFQLGCFAGALLEIAASQDSAPPSTTILHTAPLRMGDSGGPLATADGRLLAINVGDIREFHLFRFAHQRAGRAQRPDLGWLKQTVEADFASSQSAAVSPPPTLPP